MSGNKDVSAVASLSTQRGILDICKNNEGIAKYGTHKIRSESK